MTTIQGSEAAQTHDEIERAIRSVKRTTWDKCFRRQWYKAAAQRRRRAKGLATGWR